MHLKKKGTVLISTMIILSLMLILGNFLFNMMKNNRELEALYKFDADMYDLSIKEEKILNQFMQELNNNENCNDEKKENIVNQSKEQNDHDNIDDKNFTCTILNEQKLENKSNNEPNGEISNDTNNEKIEKKDYFGENFTKSIDGNILEYTKYNNKLYLTTKVDNKANRKREIKYKIKNKKIILIPTYKFENL